MGQMKIEKYKKLYSLSADEFDLLDDNTKNQFIFQGSRNWDFYFNNKNNLENYSALNNVALLNFDNEEAFEGYLSSNKIIDYSLEHIHESDQYCVLIENHA
jgi:hypothetical protein